MVVTQRAVMPDTDDDGGDASRGERGQRHVHQERPAREVEMPEHDQIGQVGSGQHERPRVGEQEAGVHEWRPSLAPAARRVHQHGREEDDRSVEIEHRRDRDDEDRRPCVEGDAIRRQPRQGVADCREETVLLGHESDEDQAGDEDERGPVLGGRRPGITGRHDHRRHERSQAKPGQPPRRIPAPQHRASARGTPTLGRVAVVGRS